jgi:hypothetical protein
MVTPRETDKKTETVSGQKVFPGIIARQHEQGGREGLRIAERFD